MIQSRRSIEPGNDLGKLRNAREPPFVGPPSRFLDRVSPSIPPGRDETGQRFDDQHRLAAIQQA